MHKIQFARGIHQRDLLRANTLPSISRAKVGCFARMHLHEENARFILVLVLLLMYISCGAVMFGYLERENEIQERAEFDRRAAVLRKKICVNNSICADLDELLALNEELSKAGYLSNHDKFDLLGAFFFCGTVVSTIGFGMSTPRTTQGKIITVFYGTFGCTCCVLFFNLFLERLITALTYILRYFHEQKIRKRQEAMQNGAAAEANKITLIVNDTDFADSASSFDGRIDQWRPSVYKVFGCVLVICAVVMTFAATVYAYCEDWSFDDALYFCFTSFATIGFGDFVPNSAHQPLNINQSVYRFVNFMLLSSGACLVYCLFNISSIVIKQFINWIIKHLDVKVENEFMCLGHKKPTRYMGLGLRPPPGFTGFDFSERSSVDSNAGDGLLSLKEFLMYNHQNHLVMLQKQLIKSAYASTETEETETEKISASRVGPMGILSEKFGDDQ